MAILKALGTGGQLLGGAVAATAVAVGGYVAYDRMSGAPGPVETETAASDTAASDPQAAPDAAPGPTDATDVADPPDTDAPAPPRFDLVRVDPEGSAVVAGQAAPQAEIAVLVDGEEAAVSIAGSDGGFVAMFSLPPSERARVITLAMRRDVREAIESEEQVLIAATRPAQPPVAEDMVVARAPDPTEAPDPGSDAAGARPEPAAFDADEPATPDLPAFANPPADALDRAPGTDRPGRPEADIAAGAEPDTPTSDDPVVARVERASDDDPARGDPALGQVADTAAAEVGAADTAAPGRPAAVLEGADAPVAPAPVPDGAEAESPQPRPDPEAPTPGDSPATPTTRAQPDDPTRPEAMAAAIPADVPLTPTTESEAAPEPAATAQPAQASSSAAAESSARPQELEPQPAPEPDAVAQAQRPAAPEEVADARPVDDVPPQPAVSAPEAADTAPAEPDAPDAAVPVADPDAVGGHEMAGSVDAPATASRQAPAVLITGEGGVRVMSAPEAGAPPEVMDNVVIDAISYTPDGAVRLSGRSSGAGDGAVRLYLDNQPLTTVMIGPAGAWETELPDVDTGVYALRADELDAAGAVVSRFETPFRREAPEQLARAGEAPAEGARADMLTVQPGYTLWGISRRSYGRGILYVQVFEANRDQIADPDLIYPGQVFAIPEIPEEAVDALP